MQNEDDDAQRRMISVCTTRSGTASGACPWRHLNMMTAVLKVTRCRTGSQYKLRRTGVMLTVYDFLIVLYIETLSLRRVRFFEIFDFRNAVTLKTGLGVRQGHWKCHHAIEHIRLPIDVL